MLNLILGCTELPILLYNIVLPVKCLDTVDIHINKLLSTIDV